MFALYHLEASITWGMKSSTGNMDTLTSVDRGNRWEILIPPSITKIYSPHMKNLFQEFTRTG